MKKTFKMNELLDYYEYLLSKRQRMIMDYYYREDYSLNEIGEILDISKQSVSDTINRAEMRLQDFEEHLHLFEKKEREEKIRNEMVFLIHEIKNEIKDAVFLEKLHQMETLLQREEDDDDI